MNRYDENSSTKHFQRVGEQPRKLSLKNYKNKKSVKESDDGHESGSHGDYNRKADKNYLRTVLPILQSKLHH